jgi:hypothetical protein
MNHIPLMIGSRSKRILFDRVRRSFHVHVLWMLLALMAAFHSANAQAPPASFTTTITNGANSVTVDFTLHPIRSPNFSVIVQNSSGAFDSYTAPAARTYLGTVQGRTGAIAAATLKPDGTLISYISFENGVDWFTSGASSSTRGYTNWGKNWPGFTMPGGGAGSSVYAAEVGVDSTYEHFERCGSNVNDTIYIIEHSILATNVLYLRDAGILHRVGRIVIRASQAKDPYQGLPGNWLLGAVRDQWNGILPPSTHDVALIATTSRLGGGVAYKNGIAGFGGNYRYGAVDSDGNGDFNVYWRHEVGHNWSADHYEGNAPEGPTIMSANQLGRISSPELVRIAGGRNSALWLLDSLGSYSVSLPPRASMDIAYVPVDGSGLIDVLANDHDANGNSISIHGFDAKSNLGGAISLSGGNLQVQGVAEHNQMDWFNYRIIDSTGRTGTGIVYLRGEKSSSKLTGTAIGTPGSWGNAGNTLAKALDGNLGTFYDAVNASGDWVGLDLGAGSNFAITKVKFCPRSGFADRMNGGMIQVSNVADFSSGVVTLFTVGGAPATGVLTSELITNNTAYRYVRYLGPPNAGCNIAEIEFWGSAASVPHAPFSLTAAGTGNTQISLGWRAPIFTSSYRVKRSSTSGGPYTTVASGLTATTYTDTGLTAGSTYYYVVTAVNELGESASTGQVSATTTGLVALTGTVIGTPGSWGNSGNTIDKAFDGNLSTYYDAANGSGDWVGLDLGIARSVRQIKYCPRWNYGYRMYGGVFEGSNSADFSAGVVTLGTITTTPPSGGFSTMDIPNADTFRYVRYVGPGGGACNVAELEFAGTPSDLLMHLRFDETGGTTAADSSGNGYHAALLGGPTFGAGQLGNAVNFASASSQYATLPSGVVGTLNDFTITAWVKPTSFATWARVFDFGSGTSNYMFLSTQYTGTAPNGAKPRFAIRTASVNEQGLNSSIALTGNAWNHLAVTLSGNTATLYVNGSVAATNTGVTLRPSSLGNTSQNYLADSQWSGDPYFNGGIDDFRIYGRALSASEIGAFQTPLTAPQNVAATSGPEQISLTWNPVPSASRYVVKSATTADGPYDTVATLTETSFTHTGLSMTPRHYLITAENLTGTGYGSTAVSATPESAAITEAEMHRSSTIALAADGASTTLVMNSSIVGHTYQAQFTDDLANGTWEDVGFPQAGNGGELVFEIPLAPGTKRGFFRFVIQR